MAKIENRLTKKIVKHSSQDTKAAEKVKLDEQVTSIIKEYPLAQVILTSNDNIHDQIIYLPLRLDQERNVLTGHLFIRNKLAWLLESGATVTLVFQGDDVYISPLFHEKIKVPTWNYRRIHISGQFTFLSPEKNKEQVRLQVEDLEADNWSMDSQPEQMIQGMLANIRCFEISIERVDKIFKVDQKKPLVVREAITNQLIAENKQSLAEAHLKQAK